MRKWATVSQCERYRFDLGRDGGPGTMVFCLNNPSTADAETEDPTSRRGYGFTLAFRRKTMVFVNTNPHRSTNPKLQLVPDEATLAKNDNYLRIYGLRDVLFVCAWGDGAKPELALRAETVLRSAGARLWCFGLTAKGNPKHPLYLPKGAALVPFPVPEAR